MSESAEKHNGVIAGEQKAEFDNNAENQNEATVTEQDADFDPVKIREDRKKKMQEAIAAMSEGRGKLKLNTPILSGEEKIEELTYDFTALTGMEYTDAMDSDLKARELQKITHRQGLALFAAAAAKYSNRLDVRDIIERISAADAIEAVELATIFFAGSARAGRLRISKK